jgi:hypothetical protein
MIKPEDVRFHTPSDLTYYWAETNYFSVYLPEPSVTAWIYVIARPGVGAMAIDVEVIDRVGRVSLDALYFDFQQHLPLPARLEDFELPNGLSVKTSNEPLNYQIDYIGVDNTEFHWTMAGLMPPFDIYDPTMDPLASPDPNASGFGIAYSNHFDMTVHVTGNMKIRGQYHNVDCITVMDHSWGPRNERGLKPMGWINGNFDRNLAFHTIWAFDPLKDEWDQFTLAHGYVLIEGEVRGLCRGRIRAVREGPFAASYECTVFDKEDREYRFAGDTIAQHPWSPYSNSFALLSTVKWRYERREGVGLAQENWPLDLLTGRGLGFARKR